MPLRYLLTAVMSVCILVCNLNASPQNTDFSQRAKPATLKVLLHQNVANALIEVKGRHHIYNPANGVEISWGIVSRKFPLKSTIHGIHWGEQFPGTFQLRFVPGDSQSCVLVNGIQYRGCVEVYLNNGFFNVINEVDVESYLKSTLSSQFTTPLPDEVLNSIAIVERTNAYFLAKHYPDAFWHVSASEIGYKGACILPKSYIDKAVSSTYHAILTYHDEPFATCCTEDSAGQTIDFATLFRKSIQTPPGVNIHFAKHHRPESKWTFTCPKSELEEAAHFFKISHIDLYVVPETTKVYGVKLSSGEQEKDIDFLTFQKLIGPHLQSNDFSLEIRDDQCFFTGYGKGPSVGLCLYTAKMLSDKGEKAPQILQTFYPSTRLEKIRSR